MTAQQKTDCPDIYRRLKLACIRAGESAGQRTVYVGRYERPIRKVKS